MKVFLYINVLGGGGAERVVANLANQLSDHGHDVGVITSFSVSNEYYVKESVLRFVLDTHSYRGRIVKNYTRIKALRYILKKEKPDVLISFMAEPNTRAIIAASYLKTKVIVSVRNDPNREYSGTLGHFIGKSILPMADGCVFQTKEAQQWFPKKLQVKSNIILNQVNPDFFSVTRKQQHGRIVTLGRLSKQKNHLLLIKAFSEIVKKYPYAELHIYGEGEMFDELSASIKNMGLEEKIYLDGNTKHVKEVLAKTSIFVLPSDYEGMPNALMEAMSVGVPCISTDCPCGGPRMIITNRKNGLLFPVGEKEELVEMLDFLLADENERERIGREAKEYAKMQFDTEKIYNDWEQYLLTIVGE